MKTTKENNRLIAEFMGFQTQTDAVDDRVLAYYIGDVINADNSENENEENVFHPDDMKFHTSWDWLMPVVSKITNQEKYIGLMHRENIMDTVPYGMIDDTYSYVVGFIEWYNKQNKFICGVCGDHVNEYTYNEEKDVDECNNCRD